MQAEAFTIRQFTPADISVYKAIRLEALQTEPGNYGNSHAMELAMSDDEWAERITNPLHARFGLYCNHTLIGLTGIIINKDKPQDAYMTQSYIRREYRGRGLSRMLYDARFAWAKQYGIKRFEICHRASNHASKAANQHYGFTYTHTELRTWPDGITEDNIYYELMV